MPRWTPVACVALPLRASETASLTAEMSAAEVEEVEAKASTGPPLAGVGREAGGNEARCMPGGACVPSVASCKGAAGATAAVRSGAPADGRSRGTGIWEGAATWPLTGGFVLGAPAGSLAGLAVLADLLGVPALSALAAAAFFGSFAALFAEVALAGEADLSVLAF